MRRLGSAPLLAAAVLGAASLGPVRATSLNVCDATPRLSAAQQDRMLRVSAVIKAELERSATVAALVARSGLNLGWLGQRYSHAGFALRSSPAGPWAVRQLYYACDDRQPRLFDQGMPAFLMGTDDPALGYVSVLLLPAEDSAQIEPMALDSRRALQLLGPSYSANAHAFSAKYQNCNQWVIEMLALAWGAGVDGAAGSGDDLPADAPRTAAQTWLRGAGYEPTVFALGWRPLTALTAFSPYLHRDDHPDEDLARAQFRVSMPAAIEAFVHQRMPGATRVEICHTDKHVVVRHGWVPIADGCVPELGDSVTALN
jgi:hypothetical protein